MLTKTVRQSILTPLLIQKAGVVTTIQTRGPAIDDTVQTEVGATITFQVKENVSGTTPVDF